MFFTSTSDKKFFGLFLDAAQNVVNVARLFKECAGDMARSEEYADRLKELERKGDSYTHEVVQLLNTLFVTPLDREDMLNLAVKIDDVVDGVEAAAARFAIYELKEYDHFIFDFSQVLLSQAEEVLTAVQLLRSKDLQKIRQHAVRINDLENQGDRVLREGLSHLFRSEKDPIALIKKKEVYEILEQATDRCEDVANALESVVMKNQ